MTLNCPWCGMANETHDATGNYYYLHCESCDLTFKVHNAPRMGKVTAEEYSEGGDA